MVYEGAAAKALDALGDPTRRAVFEALAIGPHPVGQIAAGLPVSRPAVSQHLRVLKEAGLVASRAEAQRRVYSINPAPLRQIDRWLQRYRKFWSDELDSLERHLDRNP